jgi:hypothetical protein
MAVTRCQNNSNLERKQSYYVQSQVRRKLSHFKGGFAVMITRVDTRYLKQIQLVDGLAAFLHAKNWQKRADTSLYFD